MWAVDEKLGIKLEWPYLPFLFLQQASLFCYVPCFGRLLADNSYAMHLMHSIDILKCNSMVADGLAPTLLNLFLRPSHGQNNKIFKEI